MLRRPCLTCGSLGDESYCREHNPKLPPDRRGYDFRWAKLSRRARELQPFCSDCLTPGTPGNGLTLDHTPAAWDKVKAGKRLTLKDAERGLLVVRCQKCNNEAGPARGWNVRRA